MKVCSDCKITKPLSEFYKNRQCRMGVSPKCKECSRAEQRFIYEMRKKFGEDFRLGDLKKLPEGKARCAECGEVKDKSLFYKNRSRRSGVSTYCKICTDEKQRKRRQDPDGRYLDTRRKWAERNRERLREQDREYKQQNRERLRLNEQRRRARKANLPDTLTESEMQEILTHFGNKCALCEGAAETLDHFIPLVTGFGGTTKENIVPLCQTMNASKHGRNPFEWAEMYLNHAQRKKFQETVKYLADLNGLTIEEYREFVFSCFENKKIS